jgi:hypothetical protein
MPELESEDDPNKEEEIFFQGSTDAGLKKMRDRLQPVEINLGLPLHLARPLADLLATVCLARRHSCSFSSESGGVCSGDFSGAASFGLRLRRAASCVWCR